MAMHCAYYRRRRLPQDGQQTAMKPSKGFITSTPEYVWKKNVNILLPTCYWISFYQLVTDYIVPAKPSGHPRFQSDTNESSNFFFVANIKWFPLNLGHCRIEGDAPTYTFILNCIGKLLQTDCKTCAHWLVQPRASFPAHEIVLGSKSFSNSSTCVRHQESKRGWTIFFRDKRVIIRLDEQPTYA